MTRSSAAIARFGRYLDKAKRRESYRITLKFLAILALLLILVTVVGAAIGLFRGFTPPMTTMTRVILLLVLAFTVAVSFLKPLTRLKRDGGAKLLEQSDAAFDGRVQTFLDTHQRESDQPFLGLLARDALSVARRVPLSRIVPGFAMAWPVLVLITLVAGVFGVKEFAPQSMKNAAMHIWWGWKDSSLVEQRNIAVKPGAVELLAGEDLDIDIALVGFSRTSVTLHVRTEDADWQNIRVDQSGDNVFAYTVFRVNQPMEYYVSAGEDVGDIDGVKNTQIELTFHLDRALQDGVLQVGDTLIPLEQIANPAETDEVPQVRWLKPGRDVSASPVEEVMVQLEAKDDFAIESIELFFSVNAGEWRSIKLPTADLADHVFYLESMGDSELNQPGDGATDSNTDVTAAFAGVPMQPGDLVSYYAVEVVAAAVPEMKDVKYLAVRKKFFWRPGIFSEVQKPLVGHCPSRKAMQDCWQSCKLL